MEVRRAVGVSFFAATLVAGSARADDAGSAKAAFPDVAAPGGAPADPGSRAGFPAPTPPSTAAPQYRGAPPAPTGGAYSASSAPVYGAPSAGASPPPYPYGWSAPASAYPYGGTWGASGAVPSPDKKTETQPEKNRYVSLTVSPLHLALPVLEATVEARLADHLGIAAVGGFGEAPPQIVGITQIDVSERYPVRELGAQLLVYPLGAFDGFVVGGELTSIKVSGTAGTPSVDVDASVLGVGPLLGGKWIHSSGFTLFGHVGVQRLWLKADATVQGQPAHASDARWFPLVNLNFGWSF